MAKKDNKIEFELGIKASDIKNVKKQLEELHKEGQLSNTNQNTYKSLMGQLESMMRGLKEIEKSGGSGTTALNNISKAFLNISNSLSKIKGQELSAGLVDKDKIKQLERYEKTIETISQGIEKYKQKLESLSKVSANGKVKKEDVSSVMKDAAAASKGNRKGPMNSAEKMLATGDMKALKQALTSDDVKTQEAAAKAMSVYEKYTKDTATQVAELTSKMDSLNDKLNQFTNKKNDLESSASYNTETVKNIDNMSSSFANEANRMKDVGETAKLTGQQIEILGEKQQKTDTTVQKAAKTLISYSVVYRTLKNMMKQAIQTVVQLDSSITEMTLVTGKSREEMQQLVPQLQKVAQSTSTTVTEVANLTTEYIRQGRTIKDSLELAEQTAKAAKIAGISASDAIQYMTAAVNGFNLSASDASHVSDVFAKLAANSATNFENLAIALSKVSAQANTAGMSIEYTTALLAKGIETTQEAPESIGTALKTVIARMREITDYGASLDLDGDINSVESALKAVGVSLRDSSGQFRDLDEVLGELGPKWDSLNTMQQQAVAQAVAGTRQQARFLAIMQDWDRTLELVSTATDAAGASQYQYNQMAKGFEAALTNLTTAWQSLVQNLVNNEFLVKAVNTVTDILNGVNGVLEAMGDIPSIIAIIVIAVSGLLALREKIGAKERERIEMMREQSEIQAQQLQLMAEMAGKQDEINIKKEEELNAQEKLLLAQEKYNNSVSEAKSAWKDVGSAIRSIFTVEKKLSKQVKDRVKANAKQAKQDKKNSKDLSKQTTKLTKQQKKDRKAELKDIKLKRAENSGAFKEQAKAQKTELNNLLKKQDKNVQAIANKKLELETQKAQNDIQLKDLKALEDKGLLTEKDKALQEVLKEQNAEINKSIEEQNTALDKQNLGTQEREVMDKQIEASAQATAQADAADAASVESSLGARAKAMLYGIGDAVASIAKAAASMVGMAAAAAAASFLVAGLAAAGTAISGSLTGATGQQKINDNQDTIYENKEKKSNLQDLQEQYRDLYAKQLNGTLTADERAEMEEIVSQMQEIDDTIEGSGQQLLNKVDEVIDKIDQENKELIESNYKELINQMNKAQNGGFWGTGSDEAKEFLNSSAGKLALTQYQQLKTEATLNSSGVPYDTSTKANIIDAQNNVSANLDLEKYSESTKVSGNVWGEAVLGGLIGGIPGIFGAISRRKAKEETAKAKAEEDLNTFNETTSQLAIDLYSKNEDGTSKTLSQRIESYKEAYAKIEATENDYLKEVMKDSFRTYEVLSNREDEIADFEKSLGSAGSAASAYIENLTNKLIELGATSEQVSNYIDNVMDTIKQRAEAEIAAKVTEGMSDEQIAAIQQQAYENAKHSFSLEEFAKLDTMDSKALREHAGITRDRYKTDEEYEAAVASFDPNAYKNTLMDYLQKNDTGYNAGDIKDAVESRANSKDTKDNLISNILSGSLTSDDYATLGADYQSLMANDEFLDALNNNPAKAAKMINDLFDAGTDNLQDKLNKTNEYYDALIENVKNDKSLTEKQKEEQIQMYTAQKNTAAAQIKTLDEIYEKIDENENKLALAQARQNELEEEMSDNEYFRVDTADKLRAELEKQAKILKEQQQNSWDLVADTYDLTGNIEDYYDIVDGQLIPKLEVVSQLDAQTQQAIAEWAEEGSEFEGNLDGISDKLKEINEEQLNGAVEIQEAALEVMQARLEAEYDATKESLNKRRELYEKYFDALEDEEDEEDYENDREALLNKIAKLSTATDANSLAKLKEAQEALAELDEEHNDAEREARKEAVLQSFDDQEEALDEAYEKASENQEALWQEFAALGSEAQEELMRKYGEGFQNATELQKQVAEKELNSFLTALSSYSGIDFEGVSFTGESTNNTPVANGGEVDSSNVNNTTNNNTDNSATYNPTYNITISGTNDDVQIGKYVVGELDKRPLNTKY